MWSHYSSQHSGLCIQFDTARDPRTFASALPVTYVNTYPVINWLKDLEKSSKRAVLNKHCDWKYEKESRIIKPEAAHTKHYFKPLALRSIIIGCMTTDAAELALCQLLEERRYHGRPIVCLYRAYKHNTKYKLYLRKISA